MAIARERSRLRVSLPFFTAPSIAASARAYPASSAFGSRSIEHDVITTRRADSPKSQRPSVPAPITATCATVAGVRALHDVARALREEQMPKRGGLARSPAFLEQLARAGERVRRTAVSRRLRRIR